MQTFLSEPTFKKCAVVLDNKRLNKQLLEARQILNILVQGHGGWYNHPAVQQWKGYEPYLFKYIKAIKRECKIRGIAYEKNYDVCKQLIEQVETPLIKPWWWSDKEIKTRILITHRARLYEKDSDHYRQYKEYVRQANSQVCCERCNYCWPAHLKKGDS